MSPHGRLLIVDDEAAQMRALCDTLGFEGYTTKRLRLAQRGAGRAARRASSTCC